MAETMRYTGGWVKLNRSIIDHWITEKPHCYILFIHLILIANYKDSKFIEGDKVNILTRGQILTSLHELSAKIMISIKTVARLLNLLESDGMIVQKRDHSGTHITICNYEKYQFIENDDGITEETPREHQGNTTSLHSKEYKQYKNKRINPLSPDSPSLTGYGGGDSFELEKRQEPEEPRVKPNKPKKAPKIQPDGSKVWDAYQVAFKSFHGVDPLRNAKSNGLCSGLVKSTGLENALKIIESYFSSREAWVINSRHPLEPLVKNPNRWYTDVAKQDQAKEDLERIYNMPVDDLWS